MDKRQLIAEIRKHNVGVEDVFLLQFSEADLQSYLERLESARRKERLIAGWVRPKPKMRIAS
jgi:hypothetical protein